MPETVDEQRAHLKAMRDEDIDFSDIPEITDFTGFVRLRDFPNREAALAESRRRQETAAAARKLAAE